MTARVYRVLLLLLLALVAGGAAPGREIRLDAGGVTQLRVRNGSGKVLVTGSENRYVSVVIRPGDLPAGCTDTVEREGSAVLVTVTQARRTVAPCAADLEIVVPKSLDVSIESGSGGVTVLGTAGALTFAVGDGDVSALGGFREVTGKSGTGNVSVQGLTGNASLSVVNGRVSVGYNVLPSKGAIDIRSGTGDVELCMPEGSKIAAHISVLSGTVVNRLGHDPGADFLVTVHAGTGRVLLLPVCIVPTASK